MSHMIAVTIVLQMSNLADAPRSLVRAAQAEVTRVYGDIGVHVDWAEPLSSRASDQPAIRVVLLAYETGDLRRSPSIVMGAAVPTPEGTRVAYVFYRRVRAEAERHAVSGALVLACAIAHELGHVLLPLREHSPAGLMRACWNRDDFQRAEQGRLRFSADEGAEIRARLAR
jgi:hypothetical protein